jgi:hypothetical protein
MSAVESLFEGFGNKAEIVSSIKDIQVSANAITRKESISYTLSYE